ncbi:hypothetical protein ACFQAS_15375 [Halopenitus salinus]|uniref:DUF4282 domain-containing protein n=1 Tax=Halopenitus salinus TaxID=1198295 RepID=A0ABD5UQ85_9EURY
MAHWSSPALSRSWLGTIVVLYALILAYAIVIVGQLVLGVLPGLVLIVIYLFWRLVVAIEAIADAQQRMAGYDDEGNGE